MSKKPFKPILAGVAALSITACTTMPSVDEMEQVSADEVRSLLVGNTAHGKADWGTWYQTYDDNLGGNTLLIGNGWRNTATATTTLSDSGELCSVYEGEEEWSKPEHRYCDVYYRDAEGTYYLRVTVNTRRPERVGKMGPIQILEGDPRGLNAQGS